MNSLMIEGVILNVLPEQAGMTPSGKEWRRQDAVLQTVEQYPKTIAFSMFNNRIVPLQAGVRYQVTIDLQSREYNGRWYTNVNALQVMPMQQPQQAQTQPYQQPYRQTQQAQQAPDQQPKPQQAPLNAQPQEDDLPF